MSQGKEWWELYGDQAKDFADRHMLPGPTAADLEPWAIRKARVGF